MHRIVDTAPFYPPHIGGLESFAEDFHRQLVGDPGVQVEVLTSALGAPEGRTEPAPGWTIERYAAFEPVPSFTIPKRPGRFRRLGLTRADTVVTHTRFFVPTLLAGRAARRTGATWIHFEHGGTPVRSGGWHVRAVANLWDATLGKWILRRADHVLVLSDASRQFVRELSGRTAEMVRCGMTLPEPAWAPPIGRPTLLFVGRLIDAKGCVELLRAHAVLEPRPALRMVGSGAELASLAALAAELGTTEDVTFVGPLDPAGVQRELAGASMFVSSSHTEGLGLSIVEAAAAGLPIVATRAGGTLDTVLHERTGLLVEIRDVEDLACGMQRLLDDPTLARQLGAAAREHVREVFSWDEFLRRVRDLLPTAAGPT